MILPHDDAPSLWFDRWLWIPPNSSWRLPNDQWLPLGDTLAVELDLDHVLVGAASPVEVEVERSAAPLDDDDAWQPVSQTGSPAWTLPRGAGTSPRLVGQGQSNAAWTQPIGTLRVRVTNDDSTNAAPIRLRMLVRLRRAA